MNLRTFYAASVLLGFLAVAAHLIGLSLHAQRTRAVALHRAQTIDGNSAPAPAVDHHAAIGGALQFAGMALAVSALVCLVLSSLRSERTGSRVLPLSFLIAYVFLFLLLV